MQLLNWATRHNITPQALAELTEIFGSYPAEKTGLSESSVQTRVRLEASRMGARLWRNNTGVFFDERGVPVRSGLCNESAKQNAQVKSSDLIGIKPIVVTQGMVGSTIGQFMAREVKKGDWHYTGTPREIAQLKFLEIVNGLGGDGRFTNGSEEWVIDSDGAWYPKK